MPIEIVRNDITKMTVDAIVNAANTSLLGGGGVDGAIHRAAGRELLEECRTLGGCKTGEAKITKGYKLPCKYVIHTPGPVWNGGVCGERELLTSCYKNSLRLAAEHGCESVAFPLISSGIYGYPKAEALQVAVDTIAGFLTENEMMVYIVIFDKASFDIGGNMFYEIQSFIDENYVEEQTKLDPRLLLQPQQPQEQTPPLYSPTPRKAEKKAFGLFAPKKKHDRPNLNTPPSAVKESSLRADSDVSKEQSFFESTDISSMCGIAPVAAGAVCNSSLADVLETLDESFSECLLRMIDERGLTDPQVYKKANVDRKLFSKIRGNKDYHPKKQTAVAFAIALELGLAETKKLLETAGFALSHSSKFDVIIEYFISKKQYNIYEINEALFAFDQTLLG